MQARHMTPYPDPVFEGFAIEMVSPRQTPRVRQIVAKELGKGWKSRRFGDQLTDYEVTSRRGQLSVDQAWQMAYRLRAQPGVAYAEPLFEVAVSNRTDWSDQQESPAATDALPDEAFLEEAAFSELCFDSVALPESGDPLWSINQVRVPQAWQRFFPNNASPPGTGIVIGHPDTGYRKHPEIVGNLLISSGYDFVDDNGDAEDELQSGFLRNPGHGTGTASVIVSAPGAQAGLIGNRPVTGVAPGAKLIPIRVSRSVVLLSTLNLARAIEHATRKGAHVISISMGGLSSWRLRQAVVFAQTQGVIVLAAAGNCVGFVAWPAAYDEVIAVAACNAQRKIWRGSSHGSAVDVTAPGESVWRAGFEAQTGGFIAEPGTGTSFAVATVAGVAALWLAHHGRDQLIQQYGAEKIPFIFNQVLRNTCVKVNDPSWTAGQFGAGLVDAEAVLAAPLPNVEESVVLAPGMFLEGHVAIDQGGTATFAHLFEQSLVAERIDGDFNEAVAVDAPLRATLADLLQTTPAELPQRLKEVGQELAFHLATNPRLYKQVAAALDKRQAAESSLEEAATAAGPDAEIESVRAALHDQRASRALRGVLEGRS